MPATFYAKAPNFRIVLDPQVPVNGSNGQQSWTQGRSIQFVRGAFVCNEHTARENGFKTEAELKERLREARTYGIEFFEPDNDPRQVHPRTEDVLAEIMTCLARGNEKRLVEIVAEEESTHERPEVLEPARRALGELGNTVVGKRGPGRPPAKAAVSE